MRPGPAGRNPERSRLWAARMTSAFRRASRVPFRTDEKEPKVRLRTLRLGRPARAAPGARYARRPLAGAPPRDPGLSPLRGPGPAGRNSKRNLREYLAITRRLPPLPAGTQAEGSIQVTGAPNDRGRKARRGHTAENNARSGRSCALRACAAKPRSFPPPRGRCAPRKSGRASPEALPVRFRRLSGRGIAPAARRPVGYGKLAHRSVNRAPPTLAAGQPEATLGPQGFGRRPSL